MKRDWAEWSKAEMGARIEGLEDGFAKAAKDLMSKREAMIEVQRERDFWHREATDRGRDLALMGKRAKVYRRGVDVLVALCIAFALWDWLR